MAATLGSLVAAVIVLADCRFLRPPGMGEEGGEGSEEVDGRNFKFSSFREACFRQLWISEAPLGWGREGGRAWEVDGRKQGDQNV